jgi:hypothetical protein
MNLISYQILEAMQSLWALQSTASTVVPGGLWYARVPQDVEVPYGIVLIEDGKKTFTVNGHFIQNFTITVSIYSAGGPGASNAKTIAALVGSTFDFCDKSITLNNARLISFMPNSNTIELQPELRNAEDVLVTKMAYEIVASGSNTL